MLTGIILRHANKELLIKSPPNPGELVYAIDTGEHGWLNNEGELVWRIISEDKINNYIYDVSCVNTEHIYTETDQTQLYDTRYANILKLDYNNDVYYAISYNISIYEYLITPEQLDPFIPELKDLKVHSYSGRFYVPNNLSTLDGIIDTNIYLNGTISDRNGIYDSKRIESLRKQLSFQLNLDGKVSILLKTDFSENSDREIYYISDFVIANSYSFSNNYTDEYYSGGVLTDYSIYPNYEKPINPYYNVLSIEVEPDSTLEPLDITSLSIEAILSSNTLHDIINISGEYYNENLQY